MTLSTAHIEDSVIMRAKRVQTHPCVLWYIKNKHSFISISRPCATLVTRSTNGGPIDRTELVDARGLITTTDNLLRHTKTNVPPTIAQTIVLFASFWVAKAIRWRAAWIDLATLVTGGTLLLNVGSTQLVEPVITEPRLTAAEAH